jgi:hypothetical protein
MDFILRHPLRESGSTPGGLPLCRVGHAGIISKGERLVAHREVRRLYVLDYRAPVSALDLTGVEPASLLLYAPRLIAIDPRS